MDVVGIGAACVDEQMLVRQMPAEDQKEHAESLRYQVGGPVPTALAQLSRLGCKSHLLSAIGDDRQGEYVLQNLREEGIQVLPSSVGAGVASSVAHVWLNVASGSRTIVNHPASWNHVCLGTEERRALGSCRLLHLDGHGGEMTVEAAAIVRSSGGKVVVDAGSPKSATEELMSLADVFSFPARFADQFLQTTDPEAACAEVCRRGAGAAVCTLGDAGAKVLCAEGEFHVPAFSVSVEDTTGAGDVFCGGLAYGLLQSWTVKRSVTFAAAAAAVKCRGMGNRKPLGTLQQILSLCGECRFAEL